MSEPDNTKLCMINGLIGASIALGLIYYFTLEKEGFHFEVTPWKKTCLGDNPCPKCCNRGYMGQNVSFAYTSDVDRMNDSLTCGERKPVAQINNQNFYKLGQYSQGVAPADFSYANN